MEGLVIIDLGLIGTANGVLHPWGINWCTMKIGIYSLSNILGLGLNIQKKKKSHKLFLDLEEKRYAVKERPDREFITT